MKKLVIWRAIMVAVTLATFFIFLYILGDSEWALIVTLFVTLVVNIIDKTNATDIGFLVILFAFGLTAFAGIGETIIAFVFILAFAGAVIADAGKEATKYGISKKAIQLSDAVEFLLILIPILIVVWPPKILG